ncbi:hypothetical protein GOODEAATRI_019859 [Goodea atripinnis]|uniref:Sodium/hydrogen exchanger n=2 Tax=Goodeidae TaxID=28758 RepID=A0ABV0PQ28_9TELE
MPARLFFDNLGAILTYAVVGTLWNAFCTGFCLYAAKLLGIIDERVQADLMDFLLFGALISAVDPVAVLAVFEEVHVNEMLFIIVFGDVLIGPWGHMLRRDPTGCKVFSTSSADRPIDMEDVIDDEIIPVQLTAVLLLLQVLYKVYISFVEAGAENVQTADYFKGVASFLIVSIGGTLVGLVFAVILGFITRFTKKVRIIEPLFVFLLVYLAYLTAELFSLSAILSMTFCGIGANKYVEANISQKSRTTVKYTMKTLASIAETIIFIFLGISAVDKSKWAWDTGLVSCTLVFIFVFRAVGQFLYLMVLVVSADNEMRKLFHLQKEIFSLTAQRSGVVGQTWVLNRFRLVPLDKIDQVVMSYGGLRGAVAFALVVLLDGERVKAKDYFVATTIVVVFFTVMFQGLTIKPLVKWLKVPRSTNRKPTINEEIHERVTPLLLLFQLLMNVMNRVKLLLRKSVYRKSELWEAYQKINIRDAISVIDQGGNVLTSARLSLPSMASRASFPEVTNVTNYLRENGSGVCLDLQVIDNIPGSKVEEDMETHHVLAGNLYKPRRRDSRWKMLLKIRTSYADKMCFSELWCLCSVQYQSHYSRHFMSLGEKERQDREVFQRNMRSRMETFKSTRYKRHKKEHPAVVPVELEEDKGDYSDPEKEEDVGITFIARKAETPKQRPKSAALDICQSPPPHPPSSPTEDSHLPWKGSVGSPPPCVSVEATKIIPVDLQQAWNQSISSLESISSPPAPAEPVHPRISALSRLGGLRPASYTGPTSMVGSSPSVGPPVSQASFCFPERKKKKQVEEEEEEEEPGASQEMQPLMSSLKPPGSLPPPPQPPPPPGSGRKRNPCVYLRNLVTTPPGGSSEPHSHRPTQL